MISLWYSYLLFLSHLRWDQISQVTKTLRALIFCEPNCFFKKIILVSDLSLYIQKEKRKKNCLF